MPKALEDDGIAQEVTISEHVLQTEQMPVFEGVKIVYMGPRVKRALSMKGRVNITKAALPDGRTIVTKKPGRHNGRQFYDFTLRDDHGQLSTRRMPDTHPIVEFRGRPFAIVEHPEHLYELMTGSRDKGIRRGEFRPSGPPDIMAQLNEYITRRERQRTGHRQQLGELTGSQEEFVEAR